MLNWKKEFETGIPQIDEQHKKLFEIGNRAYDLLNNEFYTDKYDRIIQILEELKDYTEYHFKSEEDYMLNVGYKKFFSQKVEHDSFIKKIKEVDLKSIDYNQDKYIKELLDFVFNWILEHILKKDKLITA